MLHTTGLAFLPSVTTGNSLRHFKSTSQYVKACFYGCAGVIRRHLSRALCLALVISLLATSTPAAPRMLVGMMAEHSQSWAFWFYSSGTATTLRRLMTNQPLLPQQPPEETQSARDARVNRIQIYPGDVTIHVGESVAFAAVAYDASNTPVGGVRFTWQAFDVAHNVPAKVSARGDFVSKSPGSFRVTATGAGQQAQVMVTVRSEQQRTGGYSLTSRPDPDRPPDDGGGGDGDTYWWRETPGNRRGDQPGVPADDGAGSGNFQFAAPVLGLPGRGLDISLGLAYNSRVWNKAGSTLTFDVDRDWPAPGWTLGFGRLVAISVPQGSMIVEADGTRHSYRGTVEYGPNQNYTIFTAHTTDGSLIDYTHRTGLNGVVVWAQARYPNGTVIDYSVQGTSAMYPSQITDASGNYIRITYRNNQGPEIETITDTLGRVITFHYSNDGSNLLTAISAPRLGECPPAPESCSRTVVRLHYKQINLDANNNYGFSSAVTASARNSALWVMTASTIQRPRPATGLMMTIRIPATA